MATSTKSNRKTNASGGSGNRSGLPGSTVQRANLGGGQASALDYSASDSATPNLTSQGPEAIGPGIEEISLRAYYLSERRQREGTPGDDLSDWLQAENELLGSTRS